MAHAENVLIKKIQLRHGARPGIRLFRNETGALQAPNGQWVTFGLKKGSADLIGWDHGRFVSIEVKAAGTTTKDDQKKWLAQALKDGCLAAVIETMKEVDLLLGEP